MQWVGTTAGRRSLFPGRLALHAQGLPLGNQTSQFFANLCLNQLDHLVLREIGTRAYCRYVDDFLLFHEDKAFLWDARKRIESGLDRLRLRLHGLKSRVYRTQDGIAFLGWRVFPDHLHLVRSNEVRFRRRIRASQREYAGGGIEWNDVGGASSGLERTCSSWGHMEA